MKFKIERHQALASTNDTAMSGSHPEGTIILALTQTCGRGQRGNVWCAEGAGVNLTFSLVVEPGHVAVYEQFMISMMASLSACQAIGSYVDCRIKWPNDLYVGDRKIGGILIEHQLFGSEMISRSVIGVGINVGQVDFDGGIPNPVSLALLEIDVSADEVLERFCDAFERYYYMDMETLKGLFMGKLWNAQASRRYRDQGSGQVFEAQCVDVEPDSGRMTLRTLDGELRGYWFKEVSVVL